MCIRDREKEHSIPYGMKLRFEEGDYVRKGEPLTEGQLSPSDIKMCIRDSA